MQLKKYWRNFFHPTRTGEIILVEDAAAAVPNAKMEDAMERCCLCLRYGEMTCMYCTRTVSHP